MNSNDVENLFNNVENEDEFWGAVECFTERVTEEVASIIVSARAAMGTEAQWVVGADVVNSAVMGAVCQAMFDGTRDAWLTPTRDA